MKKHFPESDTEVLRFIDAAGLFRIVLLNGPALGRSLADAHELKEPLGQLFAQAVDSLALLSADLKQTVRMVLQVKWDEGGFSLEAHWNGGIRGYVRAADELARALETGKALGGTLGIIRLIGSHPGYTGYTPIFGVNLKNALEGYYSGSEQLDSFFFHSEERSFMLQRLPAEGGKGAALPATDPGARLETADLKVMAQAVADDCLHAPWIHADDFTSRLSKACGRELRYLGSQTRRIACPCTREKISAYLTGLDVDELEDIYEHGPWPVEVKCENCSSNYSFSRDDIAVFLAERRNPE